MCPLKTMVGTRPFISFRTYLFYFVYAIFKPHILLFHHDSTYLASQLLVHTLGNTGTALITTHYGNVSLQTTCFNHQQLHGHTQACYLGMYFVLLFYTVLNLGCLNFSHEPLYFIMMKFTARCGCTGITTGAVSSTTVRQGSNKSSKICRNSAFESIISSPCSLAAFHSYPF